MEWTLEKYILIWYIHWQRSSSIFFNVWGVDKIIFFLSHISLSYLKRHKLRNFTPPIFYQLQFKDFKACDVSRIMCDNTYLQKVSRVCLESDTHVFHNQSTILQTEKNRENMNTQFCILNQWEKYLYCICIIWIKIYANLANLLLIFLYTFFFFEGQTERNFTEKSNFHPLRVVSCGSETQVQVDKKIIL